MQSHHLDGEGRPFRLHGWVGLLVILMAELAVAAKELMPPGSGPFDLLSRLTQWTTPLCWWGYILCIDAVIWKLKRHSLLCDRRPEF